MKSCKKCTFYDECNRDLKGELKDSVNDMAAECEKYKEAEEYQKNEQSAETLSELDMLAMGFVLGKVEIKYIMQLDMLNRCLVLSLAAVYSCTRIGFMSRNSAFDSKYKLIQIYKQMRVETYFEKHEHLQWVKRTIAVSTKLCEFAKAIKNKDTNALQLACEIIDLLTKEDVYNQIFIQSQLDDEYKKNCLQALKNTENFMFTSFGNIPYVDLLFKFYKACDESRATEVFNELDDDNIKKVARTIPLKNDDIEGIKKSYQELMKTA